MTLNDHMMWIFVLVSPPSKVNHRRFSIPPSIKMPKEITETVCNTDILLILFMVSLVDCWFSIQAAAFSPRYYLERHSDETCAFPVRSSGGSSASCSGS